MQYKKAQRSAENFSRSKILEKTETFSFNINIYKYLVSGHVWCISTMVL